VIGSDSILHGIIQSASNAGHLLGAWSLETLRAKTGRSGHMEDDVSFLGLCIAAGLIAFGFIAVLLWDSYKQWRDRAPLRAALKDAKRKRLAAEHSHEPLAKHKS
jgi:hypothetical protein